MKFKRRDFIPLAAAGMLAGYGVLESKKKRPRRLSGTSAVTVVKVPSYSHELAAPMLEGIRQCGLDVRGQRVLLKPMMFTTRPRIRI